MKNKTIISVVLLLFVAGSVAYLVVDEVRSSSWQSSQAAEPEEPIFGSMDEGVVVCYFYNSARCPTCMKFESYTQEALENAFADKLKGGKLVWKMVNTDEPNNKHFLSDYELYTKSIVLMKISGGKQIGWKNLEEIWGLVGDKETFVKYIRDEVEAYLGAM